MIGSNVFALYAAHSPFVADIHCKCSTSKTIMVICIYNSSSYLLNAGNKDVQTSAKQQTTKK